MILLYFLLAFLLVMVLSMSRKEHRLRNLTIRISAILSFLFAIGIFIIPIVVSQNRDRFEAQDFVIGLTGFFGAVLTVGMVSDC